MVLRGPWQRTGGRAVISIVRQGWNTPQEFTGPVCVQEAERWLNTRWDWGEMVAVHILQSGKRIPLEMVPTPDGVKLHYRDFEDIIRS